jgi:hypothetical protein
MVTRVREIQDGTDRESASTCFAFPRKRTACCARSPKGRSSRARIVERIHSFKISRDPRRVSAAIDDVLEAARDPRATLLPPIQSALGAGATLGKISGALRAAYNVDRDPFARAVPRAEPLAEARP